MDQIYDYNKIMIIKKIDDFGNEFNLIFIVADIQCKFL